MSEQEIGRDLHWNYFLALDDDLLRLSRYVEFSSENENTYSIELARILMTATAEVDVVARRVCATLEPASKVDNINDYQRVIVARYPKLLECNVGVPRHGMYIKPWKGWSDTTPPGWWTSNNKVKHQRAEHFGRASLKNALEATAALLVLLLLSYRYGAFISPAPSFLDPSGAGGYIDRAGGGVRVIGIA